jgi:hypothetical protein
MPEPKSGRGRLACHAAVDRSPQARWLPRRLPKMQRARVQARLGFRAPVQGGARPSCGESSYFTFSHTNVVTLILPSLGDGIGRVDMLNRSPSLLTSLNCVVPVHISSDEMST